MAEKIFLYLLFLCGIWSQGITGTIADEEIKQSSDLLVRQKRVISHLEGEDVPIKISDAPYVVRIRERRHNKGVGSILSRYVAITSGPCASLDADKYQVFSGTSYINHGNEHDVAEIRRRVIDPSHRAIDGVVLLILDRRTPFVYSLYVQPIRLHTGPVLIGVFGRVHGWGHLGGTANKGTDIPTKLRVIEVPIISNENCANRYRPHRQISERNVCTYHPQRHSGHIDLGAGLVVDGDLAGVFLWSGLGLIDPRYPDVYASLHDTFYNQWIRINVDSINLHYENIQHN